MKRSILFLFSLYFLSVPLSTIGCSFAFFAPDSYRDWRDPDSYRDCFSASSATLRDIDYPTGYFSSPDSLPDLNRSIIAFVDSKMKKKVGRGECWDLAAEALNASGAKWNGKLDFGRKLTPGEEILPGDIIQFEGVKIKYEETNARYTQVLKHHTGIVYSMKGKKQFDMANQNTEAHGKKVSLTSIDLEKVASGKYFIYRPER